MTPSSAGDSAGTTLLRANTDGSVDTSFGTDGMDTISLPAYPAASFGQVDIDPSGRIVVDTAVNSQDVLVGIVGDPVVAFGDASSVSTGSGTPTAVYDVSETAGTATITLTRGGDLSQPLSVPFSTDDSGGHGGVNYTPVNTTVTFAVGSATATVAIPILDDPNASPPVDIPLLLGTPSGGAVLGSVSVGDLHIVPVEGIVIAPAQIPSVMQGGAGSSFTVVLQSVPTANVTVPLTISTTSPAGVLSTSTLTFTPTDALVPQTVTVTAASGSASSPALATVSTGPATSADPKFNGLAGGTAAVEIYPGGTAAPGAIQFSAANYTVNEDAATATITLVRLGGSQGTVSVHFATSDGSPFSSGKYTPLSGSISFGPGVTSRQFSIALINPGRNLEGDQTVDLTLSSPGGGAALGVFPTATLTLHDTSQIGPGDLDPAFGTDGVAILPTGGTASSAAPKVIALQPDGKIVTVSAGTPVTVWRTDASGQPDASFGQQGEALIPFPNFGSVVGVAIAPDGKIVVAGNATGGIALFRLNSNGTLDSTFGNDGQVTVSVSAGSDTANALAVESDGSILVGAAIGNASGGSSAGLVHFNSDGSLDIGFGTAGVLSFPTLGTGLDAILQQPDGEWLLLGGGGGASIDSERTVRLRAAAQPRFQHRHDVREPGGRLVQLRRVLLLPRLAARRQDPHRRWRGAQCRAVRPRSAGSTPTVRSTRPSAREGASRQASRAGSRPSPRSSSSRTAGSWALARPTVTTPRSAIFPMASSTRPSPAEASFSSLSARTTLTPPGRRSLSLMAIS